MMSSIFCLSPEGAIMLEWAVQRHGHQIDAWIHSLWDAPALFRLRTHNYAARISFHMALPPSLFSATQQRPLLCVGGCLSPASRQPEEPWMGIWRRAQRKKARGPAVDADLVLSQPSFWIFLSDFPQTQLRTVRHFIAIVMSLIFVAHIKNWWAAMTSAKHFLFLMLCTTFQLLR